MSLYFCSLVFDDNPCEHDICVHGNCTDLVLDYRCDCFLGYGGRNCSGIFRTCDENEMKNFVPLFSVVREKYYVLLESLTLSRILLYFSERDPCADAVCRFSSDYCIYDNNVDSCNCYNFWTAPDCTGSRYGKIPETDLKIFLALHSFSLEGPFQKLSVRSFPVQPDSWTYVIRMFFVKILLKFEILFHLF